MLEVISDHVFPFLQLNDLLRLRRVCKVSKELADDYLRVYGTSKKVIEIRLYEGPEDLTNFLALTYPITLTRFGLLNLGNSPWDTEEMQTFSRLYGEKITHLQVNRLTLPIESPSTVQFFEGFPNLEVLWIENLKGNNGYDSRVSRFVREIESDGDEEDGEVEEPLPDLNLPSTFKRLKHLYVQSYLCDIPMRLKFINECSTRLERISHRGLMGHREVIDPDDAFGWIRRIVERRHEQDPGAQRLQYVDLEGFRENWTPKFARGFYELVSTCFMYGVKLQHVDARLIEGMMGLETPDRGLHGHKISRCVVSIKNLTCSVFQLELPLLEQINIEDTSDCSMPVDFEAQPWSNLKQLKLYVDFEELDTNGDSRLFEFFFDGIGRENLESLELGFLEPRDEMTSVCVSCPNLRTLHLKRCQGSDRDMAQLWGSLPLLEDVSFEECKTLSDAAFLGNDYTRPTIWKATRLKRLSLKGLECMPGITDNLFNCALRHMPLKFLYLGIWSRVSSITLAGLESLLTGQFAETIEKFPLKGNVKLEGVTDEQLAELDRKFRSYQPHNGRVSREAATWGFQAWCRSII